MARPSAVSGRIRAVIVDPINLKAGRTFAHICEELREVVLPSRVHLDAAPTVPVETVHRRAVASPFGAAPSSVFGRPVHAVGRLCLDSVLPTDAPAVRGVASCEVRRERGRGVTADTKAVPFAFTTVGTVKPNDRKSAERFTDHVRVFHSLYLNTFTVEAC